MTPKIGNDFKDAQEAAIALTGRILAGDEHAVTAFVALLPTTPLAPIKPQLSALLQSCDVAESDKDRIIDAALAALPDDYARADESILSRLVLATILRERKNLAVYSTAIRDLEESAYQDIMGAREMYLAIGQYIGTLDRAQQNHLGFMLGSDIIKLTSRPRPSTETAERYLVISQVFERGMAVTPEDSHAYRPAFNRDRLFPHLKPETQKSIFEKALYEHLYWMDENESLPFRDPVLQRFAPNWVKLRQQLNLAGGIAAFFGVPDGQDEPINQPK